jgi:hypothetical protein
MSDGGVFIRGFFHRLDADSRLLLMNEFFSPYTNWRRWW